MELFQKVNESFERKLYSWNFSASKAVLDFLLQKAFVGGILNVVYC